MSNKKSVDFTTSGHVLSNELKNKQQGQCSSDSIICIRKQT